MFQKIFRNAKLCISDHGGALRDNPNTAAQETLIRGQSTSGILTKISVISAILKTTGIYYFTFCKNSKKKTLVYVLDNLKQ